MKDKLLLLIFLLAFILRIVGLTPNFLQHPDEPGVIEPSSKILINTVINHNPDPNVEPLPFKYASAIFYMHAIIRGVLLSTIYITNKTTGYTFSQPASKFTSVDFGEFISEIAPDVFSEQLLWIHRLPSVFFGTATVLLVYYLVLFLIKKRSIALLSALSLAVMPHHVRDSHWATVNIIQAFFFLLTFYYCAKILYKPHIKNYFLAGISAGFATSIKYFPLPILPLLFSVILTYKKSIRLLPIILVAILIGYWVGMPYIFVYFQKIINFYFFSVDKYAYSYDTNTIKPFFQHIFPSFTHSFHLQFFLKTGVGTIMSTIGLIGIIFGLKHWMKITILLLIIPITNLIFISFYLAEIYETLLIPILPFFAIFVGIGCWVIFNQLDRFTGKKIINLVVFIIIFLPPLTNSWSASLACTKTITEFESHDWIAQNISEGSVLAYQPNMRMPSKNFTFVRSEPKENFLLAEVQSKNAEYIALHSGYTDRYSLWIDDNFFLPKHIKDNDFTSLVLKEYAQNAQLIKAFIRPTMCINSRIYIYKIPKLTALKNPVTILKPDQSDFSRWKIDKPSLTKGVKIEIKKEDDNNMVLYQYEPNNFSPTLKSLIPYYYGVPFYSPLIPITGGRKYSAAIYARRETIPSNILPDGFLRLDFYEKSGGEAIMTRFSPRIPSSQKDWEQLTITTIAPPNANWATIAFQTFVATEHAEYLLRQPDLFTE